MVSIQMWRWDSLLLKPVQKGTQKHPFLAASQELPNACASASRGTALAFPCRGLPESLRRADMQMSHRACGSWKHRNQPGPAIFRRSETTQMSCVNQSKKRPDDILNRHPDTPAPIPHALSPMHFSVLGFAYGSHSSHSGEMPLHGKYYTVVACPIFLCRRMWFGRSRKEP